MLDVGRHASMWLPNKLRPQEQLVIPHHIYRSSLTNKMCFMEQGRKGTYSSAGILSPEGVDPFRIETVLKLTSLESEKERAHTIASHAADICVGPSTSFGDSATCHNQIRIQPNQILRILSTLELLGCSAATQLSEKSAQT